VRRPSAPPMVLLAPCLADHVELGTMGPWDTMVPPENEETSPLPPPPRPLWPRRRCHGPRAQSQKWRQSREREGVQLDNDLT